LVGTGRDLQKCGGLKEMKLSTNVENIKELFERQPHCWLPYALGARYSDGCVYKAEGRLRFWIGVKDKEYADNVALALKIGGVHIIETSSTTNHGKIKRYIVLIKEHANNYSVNNQVIKILKASWEHNRHIIEHCETCIAAFCKGFGDGDGGFTTNLTDVEYSNKDFRLLLYLQKLLGKLGIISIGPNVKKYDPLTFYVRIARSSIETFSERVGFTISRKQKILKELSQKYRNSQERSARVLIATNLVRLGLVRTQTKAARLLSVTQSAINNYLRSKRKLSKLLYVPEIEQLSKEYINHSNTDAIIKEIKRLLIY